MRRTQFLGIGILAVLLVLAGCSSAECKKDVDCVKPHFTGSCTDKQCNWIPIPNECGNLECESPENECTCAVDCGDCSGKAGKYLVKSCNADEQCIEDIPATAQKPITQTRELTTSGTKISVTSLFNQPFNLRKDQLELEFGINALAAGMSEIRIARLELTAVTPDKRTIVLSDKTVGKYVLQGSKTKDYLILDFPTNDKDGELTALNLKIYLDYVLTSGVSSTPKSVTLQHNYQSLKFAWARSAQPPGCPPSCDDKNPGTDDTCGPETNHFCLHTPKAGACGNNACDDTENKCTCPADCGPCSGGGSYTARSCQNNVCVSTLKPGVTPQPQSLFDDRDLGVFHLQNSYKFVKPFNTKADKFSLEFTLYEKQDAVTSVKLKDLRLLDGAQELASVPIGKELTSAGQKEIAEFLVPPTGSAEQERNLALRIWYEYVQNGETKQGDFSKALGKVVLVSPD